MEVVVFYLMITMGVEPMWESRGYGGVSITPMPSSAVCEIMAKNAKWQLQSTNSIDMDEVIIKCYSVATHVEK